MTCSIYGFQKKGYNIEQGTVSRAMLWGHTRFLYLELECCSYSKKVHLNLLAGIIYSLGKLFNFSSLQFLVNSVLPYLSGDTVIHRQGAIEAMACIHP